MNQRIVLSFLLKTVVSHSEETRSLKGLLQGAHAAWVPDRSSASPHALQELGPHSPSAAREPGTVSCKQHRYLVTLTLTRVRPDKSSEELEEPVWWKGRVLSVAPVYLLFSSPQKGAAGWPGASHQLAWLYCTVSAIILKEPTFDLVSKTVSSCPNGKATR